ncbi:hypothetical protein [Vibrio sp. VGrn 2]|nr:hypothetical protein [Vibrio sp. VGrn 2]
MTKAVEKENIVKVLHVFTLEPEGRKAPQPMRYKRHEIVTMESS